MRKISHIDFCHNLFHLSEFKEAKANYYINKVAEFRRATKLPMDSCINCNNATHEALMFEECEEFLTAETLEEKADALADIVVVSAGWFLDNPRKFNNSFSIFSNELELIASEHKIKLIEAFNIVHESNMTKVCHDLDEVAASIKIHNDEDLTVHFEETLNGIYAIFSSHDQYRKDGKFIPEGKLLKPLKFKEPDFEINGKWRI